MKDELEPRELPPELDELFEQTKRELAARENEEAERRSNEVCEQSLARRKQP